MHGDSAARNHTRTNACGMYRGNERFDAPILTGDHNISLMIQDHYHRNHDGCKSNGAINGYIATANETNGTTINGVALFCCLDVVHQTQRAAVDSGQTSRSQNERYSVPAELFVARIVYRNIRKDGVGCEPVR